MADDDERLHFETLAAQAGLRVRLGDTIATSPPISASTTFTGDGIADVHAALGPDGVGFAYARNANPTVAGLEAAVSRLYGTEDVVAFGSGMAAIHAALTSLQLWPGDHIVASSDLYGVTRSLLTSLGEFEVETHYVDVFDLDATREALQSLRPRVLYFETISNPLLRVPDAAALVALSREAGATSMVDNTFASPYLYRPNCAGVDIVVDSATKYIAGHGDVTAGLVAGARASLRAVRDRRTSIGGTLSPFEAWLALRGVRTLPLRMDRQCANAAAVADWLGEVPWVERVYYPGLDGHPQHDIAARQFGGKFGGMVAFELACDREDVLHFLDCLDLITPATSLGDVESLVLYPAMSSHRTLTPEQREATGITDGLVRLSLGIEHVDDLKADVGSAARRAGLAGATV